MIFGQTKTCLRFLNIPDRVSAEIWYLKWYQKGYENIHYEAFNMFQVEYLRERWNQINYRLCSNGSDKGSKILRIFSLRTSADCHYFTDSGIPFWILFVGVIMCAVILIVALQVGFGEGLKDIKIWSLRQV